MPGSFHSRYTALLDAIEERCDVASWRWRDVDLWPLARLDLWLDMQGAAGATTEHGALSACAVRGLGRAAQPLRNAWRSRRDLAHWRARPRRADAIFLGDGVSLDRVGGAWRDRFGEPLFAALEDEGSRTFVMQRGNLDRLPWHRPTFAANVVDAWSALLAPSLRGEPELADHDSVLALLSAAGVDAPSLAHSRLAERGRSVAAATRVFEAILRSVRPRLAFVVNSFAGSGSGFVLACKRRRVFCVDLQRAPLEGAPMAFHVSRMPRAGYGVLPDLFWCWTKSDAAVIRAWGSSRHASVHGGHTQLASFSDDRGALGTGQRAGGAKDSFTREILVALQPIGGHRDDWNALADTIDAGPPDWRWWIRRHPASTTVQDHAFGRLLAVKRPNVMMGAASETPLPVLLARMHALVSLASGAAVEAAMLGVPSFFLDADASAPFAKLISEGRARVVRPGGLSAVIAKLPAARAVTVEPAPRLGETLRAVEEMARLYSCARQAPPAVGATDAPLADATR